MTVNELANAAAADIRALFDGDLSRGKNVAAIIAKHITELMAERDRLVARVNVMNCQIQRLHAICGAGGSSV